jgi:phospholipid/cholesterol/gamma-HCH transport system permease protein
MDESRFRIDWEQDEAGTRAALAGELSATTAAAARESLFTRAVAAGGRVVVDLSAVTYLDGAGTAVLLEADRAMRESGRRLEIWGAGSAQSGLLALVDWEELVRLPVRPTPSRTSLIEQIGDVVVHLVAEARQLCAFTGALAIGLYRSLTGGGMRVAETFRLLETSGVDAAPIVVLISTLLGLIMAFLGALQLKSYGANIYVADGVAIAMVRELGPIMTAILVAGRSGSGYAAELGSMAVNDEVDALVTMGLEPVSYLVVPRVLAVVIAMPCLAMLSSLAGIAGGLAVGIVQLDLTLSQYLNETRDILTVRHIMIGLVKSVFFGLLVSAVGCYKGLSVQGAEEGVGRAATAAVVAGIFLIILADALFAVVVAHLPF